MTELDSITEINTSINSSIADDDKTQLAQQPPSAGSSEATLVHGAKPAASAATQFTQFHSGGQTASGFAEAKAIAQQVQAGMLLKKRFVLESVLGQGGMGTVYKTKDLRKVEAEDPNPYIATKVLNASFKNHPDAFVTLQQETAKSHTLAHPNIVTVHDFDRDGDMLYMTMELLQGDPLDQLLKKRTQGFPKERALAILRDLCAALAYAHQRQIIHADFKPGNVFVCDDGITKVLDFGIARAASKESQKHKFDAGQLGALTPAYATIEMMRDQPLSFADDVYALACVAYELFTGRHPYEHVSALEAKQLGLKLKPAAGLSHREWRALSHALALEKSHRTPSIAEFTEAMFPRRNTLAFGLALSASVVAIAGAMWFAYSQHQTKVQIQNTIADNMAQAQACFAQTDFACALERSLVASNLDAENTAAAQLVKASQLALQKQEQALQIENLLKAGNECMLAQDDACAAVKAKEVLALDENNQTAQQLLAAATDLEKSQAIAEAVKQAESCLQNNDVACATVFAKKATEINVNHPLVKSLQLKLDAHEQQSKLLAQMQQQKIAGLLQSAQDCLTQKKYDCALSQSNAVLALDASNSQAIEIKQSVTLVQLQGRDAETRVANILSQAKDCLEKLKNYSCAIAKAEAALDIMPNNANALAIKTRAQETQRKIKETGFTIK